MIGALENILNRPKTVLTMMAVMIVAGVLSYISIPKEANPDIDVPVYFVTVNQRGISPGDAERLLVRPLETSLRGLDGLKEVTAIAGQGYAAVILEFNIETEKDKVLADIRDKVDRAQSQLPADADEPIINETSFSLLPTIVVTLSGKVPERTLYRFARRLKDEIESVSTVREANLSGNRTEVLEVVLDLMKLESYDITQTELLTALSQNNQLVPAGFLDDGTGRFNVKVPGLVESARDVYSIPIKQNGEGVVTLGEVAEIKRTFQDASNYTRVNGEPAISIKVVKRIGTNIIANNEEVRRVVKEFSKDWPSTIKVNYLLDESSFINEVQGSLQSSILTAIALVMIVVVASLGVKSGLMVGLSIPVSFMVGFLILASAGMTMSMMVMFGMVLTVGMLVDGAIVVTEYADRKMAEGMPAVEAYLRSARLMFWPVVSSTATTLAAFLPMLMWPGVPGEFMSYLPIMVIIVLSASLITALIFLPVTGALIGQLSAWMGKNASWLLSGVIGIVLTAIVVFVLAFPALNALIGFGLDGVLQTIGDLAKEQRVNLPVEQIAVVLAGIISLGLAFLLMPLVSRFVRWRQSRPVKVDEVAQMLSSDKKLDISKVPGVLGTYLWVLKKLSGNLVGNIFVIAAIVALTIGVFGMFGKNNAGVEFFVDEEPDVAIVLVSARGNLSAIEIRDLVGEVEAKVLRIPGIDNVIMTSSAPGGGSGVGSPLGGIQDKPADVIGELQIELADYCCRPKAAEIFAEIQKQTADLAGMRVEVRKIEGGPPTGKDLRLQVKSTNYDEMVASVVRVRAKVDAMKGLQDREDSRPLPGIEWQLSVNREEAGRYNAGIAAIGSMVQLVTNGVLIGKYRPDDSDDEVDIRVRLPKEQRTLDQFSQLRLRTQNGQVPLSNFVTRAAEPKVSSITRRDGLYSMSIKANLIKGYEENGKALTPTEKINELEAWLKNEKWPSSVQFRFRGADEEQKESGAFLQKAAGIALFLMFIILVTQFNSFYQTILTLSTVILAVVGVLIGLMVTGQKFSILMTGTGVVALAGIVVNNAIVLIDTYNRMRSEGVPVRDAVLKTAAQRMRPIMLTTITTILGLVPMALQINMDFFNQSVLVGGITSIWWVQLSTAIISGLAFSTILTLVLIPTMLAMPYNIVSAAGVTGRGFSYLFNAPMRTVQYINRQRASLAEEKAVRLANEQAEIAQSMAVETTSSKVEVEDAESKLADSADSDEKVVKLAPKQKSFKKKDSKPPLAEAAE